VRIERNRSALKKLAADFDEKVPCLRGFGLGRSDSNEQIVAAREPQRLPVVLSGDEIARFNAGSEPSYHASSRSRETHVLSLTDHVGST
jgi:hypothetical protein